MLNRRISTTGGRLRVIDRAGLGRDAMLLVVSVCGRLILVGVSAQRVEKLADLEQTEEEYIEAVKNSTGNGVLPFSDILSSFMKKKKEDGENNQD
jgi:flagellar biogenesis protein FliO